MGELRGKERRWKKLGNGRYSTNSLHLKKLIITPVECKKLVVGTAFDNTAMLEDDYEVGGANGG